MPGARLLAGQVSFAVPACCTISNMCLFIDSVVSLLTPWTHRGGKQKSYGSKDAALYHRITEVGSDACIHLSLCQPKAVYYEGGGCLLIIIQLNFQFRAAALQAIHIPACSIRDSCPRFHHHRCVRNRIRKTTCRIQPGIRHPLRST